MNLWEGLRQITNNASKRSVISDNPELPDNLKSFTVSSYSPDLVSSDTIKQMNWPKFQYAVKYAVIIPLPKKSSISCLIVIMKILSPGQNDRS